MATNFSQHCPMRRLRGRILLAPMPNFMLWCLVLLLATSLANDSAVAKKVHVSDDLEDVVDNEEDENWQAWGQPKPKPPPPFDPPPDMTDMRPEQIQEEMIKRTFGPSIGFVKLRLDVKRDREEVPEIAKKWSNLLKTGSILAKIYAIDSNTLMLVIPDGQDSLEVKDFVLSQDEAYEFRLGQQSFRRPGDPPLEVVIQQLQKEEGEKAAAESKEAAAVTKGGNEAAAGQKEGNEAAAESKEAAAVTKGGNEAAAGQKEGNEAAAGRNERNEAAAGPVLDLDDKKTVLKPKSLDDERQASQPKDEL